MLKYSEIQNAFEEKNIDIEEYNIETTQVLSLPYVVYIANDGNMFGADGINYLNFINVSIVMIDETLNISLQKSIEEVFADNYTSFDKAISFAEDERLYTVTYTIQVYDI